MAYQRVKYIRALNNLIIRTTMAETIMRNAARSYRANRLQYDAAVTGGAPQAVLDALDDEALFLLRRGTQETSKIQSAVSYFVANVSDRLGSQSAAIAEIDAAINTITGGQATRQELMNELTRMRAHEDAIVDGYTNLGWSLGDVATYIENNIDDDDVLYALPFDNATYVQAWE